jgi:predicted O-methyltransferase YrrM
MSEAFQAVLADYNARAAREEEQQRNGDPRTALAARDGYLLHVGEEVARLLQAMVVGHRSQIVVEVGTSYGYSTLFLAEAARITGGRVYTLELAAEKQAYAREQLARAGLADRVEWLAGDALELLAAIPAPFDFVLLDVWKELYVPCLERIAPRMARGGILVADNMLLPEMVREQAELYRAAVARLPDVGSALLPIGQGIEVSTFWPRGAG